MILLNQLLLTYQVLHLFYHQAYYHYYFDYFASFVDLTEGFVIKKLIEMQL